MSAWIKTIRNNARGGAATFTLAATVAASLSLVTLAGCGGGGNNGGNSTPVTTGQTVNQTAGRVQLALKWPEREDETGRGRYVPPYAGSIRFTLIGITDPARRYELLVTRPADVSGVQTVAFAEPILTGQYRLVGEAFVGTLTSVRPVASAAQEIVVTADATTNGRLTLASTVARLEFVGEPLQTPVNVATVITPRAVAADGSTLFVPVGENGLRFSLVSGGDATGATLSELGLLLAARTGTVRVRVAEAGAGVSAEADVTITADGTGTNNGLAQNAFPKPGADARNSGQGGGPAAPAAGELAWQFSENGVVLETPIAAPDGSFYAAAPGMLYALTADGAKRWSVNITGGNVGGTTDPALAANGTVYIGHGLNLVAVNGTVGAILWNSPLQFQPVGAPNIGQNGTVYIAGNFGGKGYVAALNGITGAQIWRRELPSPTNICPALSPNETTLYAPAANGTLYALDAGSGADRWTFAAEGNGKFNTSAVVGPDGTVYAGEAVPSQPSQLYALDGASGALRWKRQFGEAFAYDGLVAVNSANSAVYVSVQSANADAAGVYALNPSDGAVTWRNPNMGFTNGDYSGPVALTLGGGGTVYSVGHSAPGGRSFGVSALDPQTGARLWSYIPDDRPFPVLPEGGVTVSPNGLLLFRNFSFSGSTPIRALR